MQVLYFCEWKKHEMELMCEESVSGSIELKIDHEEPKFENLWKIQEWNQYMNVCWSNIQRCYPAWKHRMCIATIDPWVGEPHLILYEETEEPVSCFGYWGMCKAHWQSWIYCGTNLWWFEFGIYIRVSPYLCAWSINSSFNVVDMW